MKCLTLRQRELLDYIQNHFVDNSYWPSIRDIQNHFGFKSTNAVMGHLRALEAKNYIARVPGQARAFRLSNNAQGLRPQFTTNFPVCAIPIYGAIAAGYPDRVESSGAIGTLQIDMSLSGVRNQFKAFALKVRGESMIDAGIFDGDIVVVEPGEPENNSIVAALIDGATTLKRYIKTHGASPYLKAENAAYPDLIPMDELVIQGIARSVIRCL